MSCKRIGLLKITNANFESNYLTTTESKNICAGNFLLHGTVVF